MRPPGHHATKKNLGGFCYFNSIAIASLRAGEKCGKVAVVDFDCHHGNGTEDILLGRKDFLYLSLHQSPLYPGTGQKSMDNCINYPIPASTTPDEYISIFTEGLKAIAKFNPDLIAVSAGFDSYRLDPITNLNLELETYREIGCHCCHIPVKGDSAKRAGKFPWEKSVKECGLHFDGSGI